ncbi:MAG: Trm112 family protein [Ilumatobacter sp.]|nr:Trm112 family protein [bacterium]MDG1265085.1 Trm112 family protein [Ilumatobacter sp.]MDG2040794.1 Trm112 family protein [Ilumatobacter sp.]
MSLSADLLTILACPEDKGPLFYIEAESILYNPRLTRSYAVRDDIPVMLVDEATTVAADDHDRIMAMVEAEGIVPTFTDS